MFNKKFVSAILLCGGVGSRLGSSLPKQFRLLNGKPLALYSFDFLIQQTEIDEIIVVVDPNYQFLFNSPKKHIAYANPGSQRQDSVYQGLLASNTKADWIIVHDSARPFITREPFIDLLHATRKYKAAALAMPVVNTIKQVDTSLTVIQTLSRDELWEIQTPQIIERQIFFKAHLYAQKENIQATDDLSLIEAIGEKALLVKSSYDNFKITTPFDWQLAEKICASN